MTTDIPERVGRYTVERLLGTGAMGSVYLGKDPELERQVAIKTVRSSGMTPEVKETFTVRFRNEARAAARLQHPAIVAVYDVGEDENVGLYLVFEYVSGATLKEILRTRGTLEPSQVVSVAEQIGNALDAAHAQGIIHRDVKPENILMTPDGRAKLADFGVARVPNATLTQRGQFLGTPCYSAPETLLKGDYSIKSDIFSFAAVLYEIASGRQAFPGEDAMMVGHRVVHEDPPPPSEIIGPNTCPERVDNVILEGLSKDARYRQYSAGALARAMRDAYAASGLVIAADPSGTHPTQSLSGLRIQSPSPALTPLVITFGFAVLIGNIGLFTVQLRSDWHLFKDNVIKPWVVGDMDAGQSSHVPSQGNEAPDHVDADHRHSNVNPILNMLKKAADATQPAPGLKKEASSTKTDVPDQQVHEDSKPPVIEPTPSAQNAGKSLSSFEREEATKDALQRARRRLNAGDLKGAKDAIEDARQLDPSHPDIEHLLKALQDKEAYLSTP